VFTPPEIASEVARQRHRDLVARADRYRLSRRVNHPSTLSGWPHFRASLLRWLLRSRARGSVTPMSEYSNLDDHASLDASEEGAIAGDLVAHPSHARAATS
jgi:hypothetical protein